MLGLLHSVCQKMTTMYKTRLEQGVCCQTKVAYAILSFYVFFFVKKRKFASWLTKITLIWILYKIINLLLSESKVSAIFLS